MPFSYSPEYRAMVLEQVRAGKLASELAEHLEVSEATIHRWRAQDDIDRGARPGRTTTESAELQAARMRIAELETELAAAKRASELFDDGRVVRPKALYPIIAQLAVEGHNCKAACRLLRVAPSGFFQWRNKPPTPRQLRRAWLTDMVTQIWEESRRTYGARRVRAELGDAHGQVVNLKLVRAIMREQGIAGLPARRRYKRSDSNRYTSSDLVNRVFERDGPNQLWMTDITEHPTTEGKVYCCAVLDAWSRRIVGWSVDKRATTAMVNSALGMAIEHRGDGRLIHTDHGPQFTSWTFSQKVRSSGLVQSIGSVGDAFDNAVIESFWGTMQIELLNRQHWTTRLELSMAMVDWIEAFYNRRRRHSSLGNISPVEFERQRHLTAA
ncbi:MAG: IS3 family transposase [Acidimicrobiales bacterium]